MEQKQDEQHEQEAALSVDVTATRKSEAAEASGESMAQNEAADTAADMAAVAEEFVPDFGPSTELQNELESQVYRAAKTAAEANDFLQRPDPNFLSLYLSITLCVCLVSIQSICGCVCVNRPACPSAGILSLLNKSSL